MMGCWTVLEFEAKSLRWFLIRWSGDLPDDQVAPLGLDGRWRLAGGLLRQTIQLAAFIPWGRGRVVNIKSYKQISELSLLCRPILKSMYPSPPLMIRYVWGSDAAVSEDSDAGSSEPESALPGGGIAWPGAKTRSYKRCGNWLVRLDLCRLTG